MGEGKAWYYIVTWLLVVAGWLIVNQQNNRREERKEIRSSLTEIHKLIYEIIDSSEKYHCSKRHDPEKSKEIRLQLQRLALKVSHLHFFSDAVNRSIYEFRSSITIKNFDTKNFSKQAENSEMIISIHSCGEDLIDSLETCFGKLFRQGFKIAASEEIRRFKKMIQT